MASKKAEKQIKKYVKKLPLVTKVIAVIVFLVSVVGSFGVSIFLQKGDKFELIGEKVITMNVGGSYNEPELNKSIECISFGRDVINSVSINDAETTYDPLVSPKNEGTYYIVYQTSDFKYSSITRIRTIVVNGEYVNEDGIGD